LSATCARPPTAAAEHATAVDHIEEGVYSDREMARLVGVSPDTAQPPAAVLLFAEQRPAAPRGEAPLQVIRQVEAIRSDEVA
jgi:hypothetical protein